MDYTNNPGTNQHPNAHDYDELGIIYQHLDSTTTVGQTVNGSAAFDADDDDQPQNWGTLVRQSRDGRTSVFELDLGNGHKIVRHVIWALELNGNRAR
jgi:hypothetical protein